MMPYSTGSARIQCVVAETLWRSSFQQLPYKAGDSEVATSELQKVDVLGGLRMLLGQPPMSAW